MKISISGLDDLSNAMKGLQRALGELEGEFGTVSFNPEDPSSIENAISDMRKMVDEKLAKYGSNEIVSSISDEIKERFRGEILRQASNARLKDDE